MIKQHANSLDIEINVVIVYNVSDCFKGLLRLNYSCCISEAYNNNISHLLEGTKQNDQ